MTLTSKEKVKKMKLEADRMWESVKKGVIEKKIGVNDVKIIVDAMERCNIVDALKK